jgi:hypothetical protein
VKVYKEVDKKELNNTTATGLGVFQTLVEINGRPTMALVDTGASASFISEELVEVLGIATQRKKHGYQLTAIDGGDLPIVDRETAPTTLKINQLQQETRFDVLTNTRHDVVLGYPWLMKTCPTIDWQKRTLEFKMIEPKRQNGEILANVQQIWPEEAREDTTTVDILPEY